MKTDLVIEAEAKVLEELKEAKVSRIALILKELTKLQLRTKELNEKIVAIENADSEREIDEIIREGERLY